MQEVKEGGQRRHSGTSGRARCSLCHSCCYQGCLNPQSPAQPHSSQPTCWPAAQCFCVWSTGADVSQIQGSWPPLTTLPPDPPPHPLSAPPPPCPWPNTMAGQEASVSTRAYRNQREKGPHETETINSSLCPIKQNGECQWKAWVTEEHSHRTPWISGCQGSWQGFQDHALAGAKNH